MRGPKPSSQISLPAALYRELDLLTRSRTASVRLVERARIIVLASEGMSNAGIARALGCSESTVRKWRGRFCVELGTKSLVDAQRSGRPARVRPEDRAAVIKLACERPRDTLFQDVWSYAALRKALLDETGGSLSISEIGRILRVQEIRPHRVRTWLHSPDPDFAPKVERICKLYLEAPANTVVLCVDEKPGMQALERKHPSKPASRGTAGRHEFEYIRHGTSTLFAALNVKTGKVFGQVCDHRKAEDLVDFMETIAKQHPTGDVYIVWDNLNTHHDGPTKRWEAFNLRHGNRFHFVHTPLHASWVNQIEIWFSILQRRVLRHGSFQSREELKWRVLGFIGRYNRIEARPFRWKFRGTFRSKSRPQAA